MRRLPWGRVAVVTATAVAIVLPLAIVVYQSFLDGPFFQPTARLSLAAFRFVLADPDFRKAFGTTVVLAVGMTAIAVPLGSALAFLVVRTDLPGRRWLEPVIIVPVFVSPMVLGFGYIVAMGPVYKSMKVEGNRAVLSFDHVGAGLECRGDKLTGFEVAGEDQKFHPADAEIRGDTVVVSSAEVEKPMAVRFGWQNYPEVNLWNKDGLPATPFRTDDWPGLTQPKERAARK